MHAANAINPPSVLDFKSKRGYPYQGNHMAYAQQQRLHANCRMNFYRPAIQGTGLLPLLPD